MSGENYKELKLGFNFTKTIKVYAYLYLLLFLYSLMHIYNITTEQNEQYDTKHI